MASGPVEGRLVDPSNDNEPAEWTAVLRAPATRISGLRSRVSPCRTSGPCTARGRSKRFDILAARQPRRSDARRGDDGAAVARQLAQRAHHRGGAPPASAPRRRDGHDRRPDRARAGRGPCRAQHPGGRATRSRRRPSLAVVPSEAGLEAMSAGNTRHLDVPIVGTRMDGLRRRSRTRPRGPDAYLEDQCALFQCMSTDEPHGDQGHEGEIWDAERAGENDALHTARRRPLPDRRGAAWCLRPAGGVHRAVDRRGVPGQACQMLTVVHLSTGATVSGWRSNWPTSMPPHGAHLTSVSSSPRMPLCTRR